MGLNLETVKTRGVIDKQLSFTVLVNVFSLEKNIDRSVEPVSMGNIRAIQPALVAKLLDGKGQPFFVDFETKVLKSCVNA